jgi:hypothetical protein
MLQKIKKTKWIQTFYAILELYRSKLEVYLWFKILDTKNKIQDLIPNPIGPNLNTLVVCHWLKNKFSERLKSRVTGVLSVQLLVKKLPDFSTSYTELSSKWRFLNIDIFHTILPDVRTRNFGFQNLYHPNLKHFCIHRPEIKKYVHMTASVFI